MHATQTRKFLEVVQKIHCTRSSGRSNGSTFSKTGGPSSRSRSRARVGHQERHAGVSSFGTRQGEHLVTGVGLKRTARKLRYVYSDLHLTAGCRLWPEKAAGGNGEARSAGSKRNNDGTKGVENGGGPIGQACEELRPHKKRAHSSPESRRLGTHARIHPFVSFEARRLRVQIELDNITSPPHLTSLSRPASTSCEDARHSAARPPHATCSRGFARRLGARKCVRPGGRGRATGKRTPDAGAGRPACRGRDLGRRAAAGALSGRHRGSRRRGTCFSVFGVGRRRGDGAAGMM